MRRRSAAEIKVMRRPTGAVELDRVLDDDEAAFGVLEGGDEEAADKTEDEDVTRSGMQPASWKETRQWDE